MVNCRVAVAVCSLPILVTIAFFATSVPPSAYVLDTRIQATDGQSWFELQRAYPTGRRPPANALDRAAAVRVRSRQENPFPLLPDEQWVSIGPSPIEVPNGLPYAGRITVVAGHPRNAQVIFIGTDGGGIWRTTDGGSSWNWLTPDIPVPAIASLAVDPIDSNLLYATTISRTYPTRLLRSFDGGQSWTTSRISTERGEPLAPMVCSVNVFKACIPPSAGRIVVDPTHAGSAVASTIYFVGLSHVFQSDDSGRTFRSIFSLGVELDFADADAQARLFEAEYIRDAVVDPVRADRLYVATATPRCLNASCTRADARVAVHRIARGQLAKRSVTTITGPSFSDVRYADPGPVYVMRIRLAISPSNPDVVALALRDEQLLRVRVFRSTNAGDDWTETSAIANSLTWPLDVAFSPTDSSTIYVASNSVYRTTNGGQSWTAYANPHTDNLSISFTADGALLVGGDGGLWTSTNGTSFTALHGALPSITEFYSVAAHPTIPLAIAGGTQDNGTPMLQPAMRWLLLTGGDGGDVAYDPDPQVATVYTETAWFFTAGGQNIFQFYRCERTTCTTKLTGLDRTVAGPFSPRLAVDPLTPATLYLTAEKLFRTDDRGDTWTQASPSVSSEQRCWQGASGETCARAQYFTAVAVAPTAPQTVYAGTLNGDVWLTNNRGATWQSTAGRTADRLPVRAVTDIAIDPLNVQTAYIAYSGFDAGGSGIGHVFRTTDAGRTWQNITNPLPDVPVNTLLIDPDSAAASASRVLYAGTDIGVFRITLDGTGEWQPFGVGLPPVVVTRLAYSAATRQLLAATYGRGIWAISSRIR